MASKGRRTVLVVATPSWRFGWGIYAINMALHWHDDPDLAPLSALSFEPRDLLDLPGLDPAWGKRLAPFATASLAFQQTLAQTAGPVLNVSCPVLHPIYDRMQVAPIEGGKYVFGNPTIGMIFSIDTAFDAAARERARRFPLIVAGCRWNQQVLEDAGIGPVALVLQGIEPSLFHPAPSRGIYKERFAIFSGGKLEYRKGQDLVLRAFREFRRRHAEALLVTAWHSPWPQLARSVDASGRATPVVIGADGKVDVPAWCAANGISASQVLDLGAVPNAMMPQVLREMDVAVFPNRSEGGTNLVAMECMACAVPTILSANTGHLDLVDDDVCFPLSIQRPVAGLGAGVGQTPGWGESNIEEIVSALEQAYADRAQARKLGERGAAKLADLTWARTAQAMKEIVLSQAA